MQKQIRKRIKTKAKAFVPLFREVAFPKLSIETLFANFATSQKNRSSFLFTHEDGDEYLSYIGVDPFEVLRIKGGKLEIESAEGKEIISGNFIAALNSYLQKYRSERIPDLPSFQGGAFGYFSYDIIRHFEPRLKTKGYFKKLESSVETLDGELMLFDRLFIFDHKCKKAYVLARSENNLAELKRNLERAGRGVRKQPAFRRVSTAAELSLDKAQFSLGAKRFSAGVSQLKEGIKAGEIFQAVLADQFVLKKSIDAHSLFRCLVQKNHAPYRFHIQTSQLCGQIVTQVNRLGASPEMLLKVENRRLETHPIAGTRPRGKNKESDRKRASQLRRSSKERAEHLMLVDLARNDLGRVSRPGSVQVTKYRKLVRFTSVMHLVSKVVGLLRDEYTSLDALVACFPAGTLSGAPKIRAMEILSEIETVPRGFYGGAVVALSFTGDLDSCIAIRCAEVQKDLTTFQAGAGIVADSKAKNEYEEIRSKTQAIRNALGAVLARK